MIFTISNTASARATALVAILAMTAGILAPMAANAQAVVVDPAPVCTVIVNSNENGDNPTNGGVETYVHPNWTEDIIGGQWLWSDALVTDTTVDQTKNFTHDFIWGGDTITNIDFQFAADNGYVVELNGTEIGSESSATNNHESVTQLTVDPSDVIVGENTLSFEITNLGTPAETNPQNNPAGFVFKMIIDGTGTNCDELPPVDVCENIPDVQETVPRGYEEDGGICTLISTTVTVGEDAPMQCIGRNLISNGSFELDAIGSDWQLVATVTNWLSNVAEGFEIWKNFNGSGNDVASDGAQNLELDVNTPSTVSQSVDTVVGDEYQVSLDFSPRRGTGIANNGVEVFANANSIGSVSANGSDNTANSWTTHTYNFTADSASTVLDFADTGLSDGLGSLLDNVSVCLVEDNSTPIEPDTYEIFGFVWDDTDEDDVREEGEDNLEGWTVRATQQLVEGEPLVFSDTTDASGRYSLYVPAGTWVVEQLTEEGWTLLSLGNNGDGTYVVVVPVPEEVSELSFLNWLIPTAHAAAFDAEAGPFNFGNDQDEERRGGGSSSGTRVGDRNPRTPTGEVLGSSTSTPAGVVLGDATTTMPVGAPNTGAGGTAPVNVSLPTLVAILATSARKSK